MEPAKPRYEILALEKQNSRLRAKLDKALDFIEECSHSPYYDSEPESLIRWYVQRAKALLSEING